MLLALTGLILILIGLIYRYLTATFDHWKVRGVPFVKPVPVFGSLSDLRSGHEHLAAFFSKIYDQFPDQPFVGYFQARTPGILVRDPELIRKIFVTDFSHFGYRGLDIDKETDPFFSKVLILSNVQRWKNLRSAISSPLTSSRIKGLFDVALQVAKTLEDHLRSLACAGDCINMSVKPSEKKKNAPNVQPCTVVGRGNASNAHLNNEKFTLHCTDLASALVLGIQCDSIENPQNPIQIMSKKFFTGEWKKPLKAVLAFCAPKILQAFKLQLADMEVVNFFYSLVHDIAARRKEAGMHPTSFLHSLLKIQENSGVPDCNETDISKNKVLITMEDITAQSLIAFLTNAGIDPFVLSFAALELAQDRELQKRARKDIDSVLEKHQGHVSYESLSQMTYLENILLETLRKYPPLGFLNRACTKQYAIPGTNVTLNEGHLVIVPVLALHHDPKYYPEPEKFMPERFEENSNFHQRPFLAFGDGPRACIGQKLVRMQAKLSLMTILRNFDIFPSERTPYPTQLESNSILVAPKGHVYVKLVPL